MVRVRGEEDSETGRGTRGRQTIGKTDRDRARHERKQKDNQARTWSGVGEKATVEPASPATYFDEA
jgi:hypothetical protein